MRAASANPRRARGAPAGRRSAKASERLLDLLAYALLLVGAAVMVGPFLWMIATSLKEPADQFNRSLIPDPVTFQNYVKLWDALPFTRLIWNSFKIASIATVGQLLTCSMAGFVFAAVRFRGRNTLFVLLLVTLMIPFQVTLIPNFIVYRWLGLYGTQIPLYLPAFLGGAFGTFLLRQYFLSIPVELAEAARIDGASLWTIYWRVYLPLARPALGALAIFTFLFSWNDLFGPLIYLPSDLEKTTLPVGLALFQAQYSGRWTVMMAGVLVSIAPIITVFFFAQRQFIEGIALSGGK